MNFTSHAGAADEQSSRRQTKRFPFATLPSGWFAVATSKEIVRGKIYRRHYFGEDFILFRNRDGEVRALEAYCPHLGADLGTHGEIVGDSIRCKFHGFRFNGLGTCTGNAYGSKPPRKARLRAYHVAERGGFVIVWYHPAGEPPAWHIPEPDNDGWTDCVGTTLRVSSHPQETSENSVDYGHFTEVHGFTRAWTEKELEIDGPVLRTAYGVDRRLVDLPGLRNRTIRAYFNVNVHGLGWSLVEGAVPFAGIKMRHYVLSTPVDGTCVDLRLGTAIKGMPVPGVRKLTHHLVHLALRNEVAFDAPIWESKRYVERPALAKGDGPIGQYRKWAKQFYEVSPTKHSLRTISESGWASDASPCMGDAPPVPAANIVGGAGSQR